MTDNSTQQPAAPLHPSEGEVSSSKRRKHRDRLLDAMGGRKAVPQIEYAAHPVEGIGKVLRAQRESLGLSPQDVSDRIKFPHQSITALEEERWEVLQDGFLLRGFVRQYAECVGLDVQRALALLAQSRGAQEDDQPYMGSRCATPTKEGYGTVYADAQAAAQAAAKSIVYNVHREVPSKESKASVGADLGVSGAALDVSTDTSAAKVASGVGDAPSTESVAMPAPVFEMPTASPVDQAAAQPSSTAAATSEQPGASAPQSWLRNPHNRGILMGVAVVVLLILIIVYLLLTG